MYLQRATIMRNLLKCEKARSRLSIHSVLSRRFILRTFSSSTYGALRPDSNFDLACFCERASNRCVPMYRSGPAGPWLFVDERRRFRERFSSAIDCSPDEREIFSSAFAVSCTLGFGSIRHERGTNCFFSLVRI